MEQPDNNLEHNQLYKIRHSLAHVLAQAVLEIRPKAKLAFGPPIENGCYYDFLFEEPITPDHFKEIEKKIRRIIQEKQPFIAEKKTTEDAIRYLDANSQNFKVEYCQELAQRGEKEIGFYSNGSFTDMCAGPHLEHTGQIPLDGFCIDSLAGAYWRGSEKNPQLVRIYCLAFEKKSDLNDYIARRKLAQERDHRKLGKELELFIFSDQVGPGLPLWTPNGTVIREELESLAKETEQRFGYQRVATPHLAKEDLYYTSGHLPYYKDSMFPPMQLEGESAYYLKAMNCPHHHQIFSYRPRSYRELPLRLAEYGSCYRYESSGSLAGLLRVRALCMNDAHIYCAVESLKQELKATFDLTLSYFNKFKFDGIRVRFSTHDPKNTEKFVDNPELWRYSEDIVLSVIKEMNVPYDMGPGEAAFYGPKIDFQAETLLGREETISTTQLDFSSPIRFGLTYVGADGKEHQPYIIHRAPLGTHERFIAFLIEHFGGAFPTWMAPTQVQIIAVNDSCLDGAHSLASILQENLVRCTIDTSDNSFNKKIREAVTHKIPNIVILGNKEIESNTVTLRRYCTQEQLTMSVDAFIDRIKKLKSNRIMDNFKDVEI